MNEFKPGQLLYVYEGDESNNWEFGTLSILRVCERTHANRIPVTEEVGVWEAIREEDVRAAGLTPNNLIHPLPANFKVPSSWKSNSFISKDPENNIDG